MAKTKTARARQRDKGIEEVVAYALGHRIRVYVLTILNEGTYTPDEIARIIDEPLNTVSHHIKELLEPALSNWPKRNRFATPLSTTTELSSSRSTAMRTSRV